MVSTTSCSRRVRRVARARGFERLLFGRTADDLARPGADAGLRTAVVAQLASAEAQVHRLRSRLTRLV